MTGNPFPGGAARSGGPGKLTDLGYDGFTPIPRTATRALGRRLDYGRFAILAALYDRDVPRNLRIRFTLDQLREWIEWSETDDYLSKRLRELRRDGWISYEKPTRQASERGPVYRYIVTLHPQPVPVRAGSELEAAGHAASDGFSTSEVPELEGSRSELERHDSREVKRSSKSRGADSVRASQRVQRSPSSLDGKVGPGVYVDPACAREETDLAAEALAAIDRNRDRQAVAAQQQALDFAEGQVALLRGAAKRGAAKRDRGVSWEPNS
jgi:hypothetical protein